jgi:hypothetical protein
MSKITHKQDKWKAWQGHCPHPVLVSINSGTVAIVLGSSSNCHKTITTPSNLADTWETSLESMNHRSRSWACINHFRICTPKIIPGSNESTQNLQLMARKLDTDKEETKVLEDLKQNGAQNMRNYLPLIFPFFSCYPPHPRS